MSNKGESGDELLEDAKGRFAECEAFYAEGYEQGEEDNKFLYGIDQWNPSDVRSREKEGRPCLTLNQLLPNAHQIVNDIRQARLAIRVSPVDDKGKVEDAEKMAGIIRNIEKQSDATTVYETAVMTAVGSGYGWIRVRTDYCDPFSFDQEIYLERVLNFQSVYIDPNSMSLDGSDADFGFVYDDMDKTVFEKKYPDAEPVSFEAGGVQWGADDKVRIVEYFYKEYKDIEIVLAKMNVEGREREAVVTSAEFDAMLEEGLEVEEVDRRMTQSPTVKHIIFSGAEILEETEWLGKYIPLVPVYADEVWIDGKRESHSFIRQAKDGQRMYNYWKTASTEFIALQQKSPYIAPVGSFNSVSSHWQAANKSNIPYLEYDIVHDKNGQRAEPPQKQPPITGSPTMMQEALGAREDIKLGLGMPDANMGQQGNEVSGVAIRNRQIEGDNASYHIVSNLSASIAQVGRICVDLIPKIYSNRKVTRIIGEDDKEKNIPINQPYIKDPETGDQRPTKGNEKADGTFNPSVGKYDVAVDVGASYSSKRQETADKLIELARAQPELITVTGDILFDVLDIPRGEDIAKRIRSTMDPAMLGEDPMAGKLKAADQAMKQMEEQLINMEAALADKEKNTQFEQQKEMQEIDLKRQELVIDAQKTQAEIAKIRSEIGKNNADARNTGVDTIAQVVAQLQEQTADITEALDIILTDGVENQESVEPAIETQTQEETQT